MTNEGWNHDPLAEVDDPMSPSEAMEALAWAEAEGQANRERILNDSVSAEEAAALTGFSSETLEKMRQANRLLALRSGDQWRYMRWQFEPGAPGGVLTGLLEVIQHLHLSPGGVAFWLLKPKERLGGAPPLELLQRHHPEPVVQLAWEHGIMP